MAYEFKSNERLFCKLAEDVGEGKEVSFDLGSRAQATSFRARYHAFALKIRRKVEREPMLASISKSLDDVFVEVSETGVVRCYIKDRTPAMQALAKALGVVNAPDPMEVAARKSLERLQGGLDEAGGSPYPTSGARGPDWRGGRS